MMPSAGTWDARASPGLDPLTGLRPVDVLDGAERGMAAEQVDARLGQDDRVRAIFVDLFEFDFCS